MLSLCMEVYLNHHGSLIDFQFAATKPIKVANRIHRGVDPGTRLDGSDASLSHSC